jgi:hypothetical protein
MVSLSSSVSVFSDGSLQVVHPSVIAPPTMQHFRVPHDVERVDWNAKDYRYRGNVDAYKGDLTGGEPRKIYGIDPATGLPVRILKPFPEVYRLKIDHQTIINCAWQHLWRALNPNLDNGKWSTLLGNKLAWTNGTGFPGHWNCITGEDAGLPLPRFDAPRICGGAIVTGHVEGSRLWIDTMLVNNPVPPAGDALSYFGTSVNPQGEINLIQRLGLDGRYYPVRVPLVTTIAVYLPVAELHALADNAPLPDATWLS